MTNHPVRNNVGLKEQLRKTVLVTGASGGIGRAICLHFAAAGWDVGIHYCRNTEEALRTASLLEVSERRVTPNQKSKIYQADITLQNEVHNLVQAIIKDMGGLSVLICNAGVAASDLVIKQTTQKWQRVIETDLTGTFYCMQAAGRAMAESGGGSIIVVGSFAGAQGSKGQAAYASAKAGLIGLVKTAACEWGSLNIRVNLIYPGWHPTALADGVFPPENYETGHILKRRPALEDIAATIHHLAELSGVSGQIWNLDSRLL